MALPEARLAAAQVGVERSSGVRATASYAATHPQKRSKSQPAQNASEEADPNSVVAATALGDGDLIALIEARTASRAVNNRPCRSAAHCPRVPINLINLAALTEFIHVLAHPLETFVLKRFRHCAKPQASFRPKKIIQIDGTVATAALVVAAAA